jgi:membrane protease YdiL (CAAX protease family)
MVPWILVPVVGLLLMDVLDLVWVGIVVPAAAVVLVLVQWRRPPVGVRWHTSRPDQRDLVAVAGSYVAVVALFRLAFAGFGTDRVAGLFLSFAAGLLLGVIFPIWYTVWYRGRSLRDLGLSTDRLGSVAALGLIFAAVQFAITLWGYHLPRPIDWVPLLAMSLVVGFFEAIFFRGFIQTRLEASFGALAGIGGAAALYAAYHIGYGMGASEMVFLFGLGVVYAIAYRLVQNVLVLWPLLTPMGAFFNNLNGGGISLPWASIAGFADVAMVMAAAVLLALRHQHRRDRTASGSGTRSLQPAGDHR